MGIGIALGILLVLMLSFPFLWIAAWVLGDIFGGAPDGRGEAAHGHGGATWR